MTIKTIAGKKISRTIKFCGEDIKIHKLSVQQVFEIQKLSEEAKDDGLAVLRTVVNFAVEDAGLLTDEEFEQFPMDELSKLSEEIMKFSGVGGDSKGK